MRRVKKLFVISIGCAGIFMFLLLSVVLIAHLLANRETVKRFLVAKTAQTTGGQLDYSRLKLALLPVPHLEARDIHLAQPPMLDLRARKLSFYPALLPALSGQIRIHRLTMVAPDLRITPTSAPRAPSTAPQAIDSRRSDIDLPQLTKQLFGLLASIDPGSTLRVHDGQFSFARQGATAIRAMDIEASFLNTDGHLQLEIEGISNLAKRFGLTAEADIAASRADGNIDLQALDLGTLLPHAALPGGIGIQAERAAVRLDFTVAGPDTAQTHFNLKIPELAVRRNDRSLTLQTVAVNGTLGYARDEVRLAIDSLQTEKPTLTLSAAATLETSPATGRKTLGINAAARQLDVAMAGDLTQSIAGDLPGIRRAFSIARAGTLQDVAYTVAFEEGDSGWRRSTMTARGRLSGGRITLPGIDTDLEEMDGDVVYAGRHVDFNPVSGRFKGITVTDLTASIDWEKEATLSIETPSAHVDTAVFYPWLTGFKALAAAKTYVSTMTGSARLSRVKIAGPLQNPAGWQLEITGTPEAIRLTTPRAPFPITLSGGQITYVPGAEHANDVKIEFMDAAFVAAYQSRGIAPPESLILNIDGTMGQEAIKWMGTLLPIPPHLQIKPPVTLSGIRFQWDGHETFSLTGGLRTAGGVALDTEVDRSANGWQIRRLHFRDGHSAATLAAEWQGTGTRVDMAFAGNIDKATVDLLLNTNQTLFGRLEGDFTAHIDLARPLETRFTGRISGEGLHLLQVLPVPMAIDAFSLVGQGSRVTIAAARIGMEETHLSVSGSLATQNNGPRFDLRVDADRLDDGLLRRLFQKSDHPAPAGAQGTSPPPHFPVGTVHLQADRFRVGAYTWSPVSAVIVVNGRNTRIQLAEAMLCGIATRGELNFSPQGISLNIIPAASGASLESTTTCLLPKPVRADARYDLSGQIRMPVTQQDFTRALTGTLTFSSENGRVEYASLLMKIFSVLNITEIFTGGKSDLSKKGYGYSRAQAKATITDGRVNLKEILLDGNSLKITGEGEIDLTARTADIYLLAAPLRTIDRIVDKLPVIGYLTGGSLVSIPLRVHGNLNDLSVVPLSPSAVGKGLLDFMERTLKAPFKLMESAASLGKGASSTHTSGDTVPQTVPQR